MTMPSPRPIRVCPDCGADWPMFAIHVCPPTVAEDNEALIALLWDVIADLPVMIGELSIATHVASCIVRPLSHELMMRRTELLAAVLEGDR